MTLQIYSTCFACDVDMTIDEGEAPDGTVLVDNMPVPYYCCCSDSCRREVAALIAADLVVDPDLLNEASDATNSEIVQGIEDDRELTEVEQTDRFLENYRNLMAERATSCHADRE